MAPVVDPGFAVDVKVTPRSSRNRLHVSAGGQINAWVSAPPTDSQANEAVCALVAKAAGLSKSSVTVASGHKARNKRLHVVGSSESAFRERLSQLGYGP